MLSRAVYETDGEGVARVTAADGLSGRFDSEGGWLDGELREADPHLCLWVAGRQLPADRAGNTKDLPLSARDEESES